MTTIATFSRAEEAHLVRTRLEAVGIPAFVIDDNVFQFDTLAAHSGGGVRLQVVDERVEEAREFLAADAAYSAPELPKN